MKIPIRIVAGIEHDREVLLWHFVEHYHRMVDEIHLFVQVPNDSYDMSRLRAIVGDRATLHRWPHPYDPEKHNRDRSNYAKAAFSSGWLMPIDSDEFLDCDIRQIIEEAESQNALWVAGRFVDRIAADGGLPEMLIDRNLSEQFPVPTELTKRILRGCDMKVLATKWPHWGLIHFLSEDRELNVRRHSTCFPLNHYKWDDTAIPRMKLRFEELKRINAYYKDEPHRFLGYWEKNQRLDIESCRLTPDPCEKFKHRALSTQLIRPETPSLEDCGARSLDDVLGKLLRGKEKFRFRANPGNAGDAVIAMATEAVFRKLEIGPADHGDVWLLGGGGSLIPEYTNVRRFLAGLPRSGVKIIILPATVVGCFELLKEFDDLTLLAREHTTWRVAHAAGIKSLLVHDAAFGLDYSAWRNSDERNLFDRLVNFRKDCESIGYAKIIKRGNRDISEEYGHDDWSFMSARTPAERFITEINRHKAIYTDRLHVGIVGACLGKEVYLYGNSYHKNKSVYDTSLSFFPNVRFVEKNGEDAGMLEFLSIGA